MRLPTPRRVALVMALAVAFGGLGAFTAFAFTIDDADVDEQTAFGRCSEEATVSWETTEGNGDRVVEEVVVTGDGEADAADAACEGLDVAVQLLDADSEPLGDELDDGEFDDGEQPEATLTIDEDDRPLVEDVEGVAVLIEG